MDADYTRRLEVYPPHHVFTDFLVKTGEKGKDCDRLPIYREVQPACQFLWRDNLFGGIRESFYERRKREYRLPMGKTLIFLENRSFLKYINCNTFAPASLII